ncbi:MAG: hypothetical protein ABI847_01610 [Anaerolineales bacterium]
MLLPIYRLADRLGRVVVKSGLKFGETVSGRPGHNRQQALAASASRKPAPPLLQLTLTPAQMPVVGVLMLLAMALVAAATLAFERMTRPTEVVILVPTLASPPVVPTLPATPVPNVEAATPDPNVVEQLAQINVVVSPLPAGPTVTAPPNPLTLGGTIYYAYRHEGYTNLWGQVLGRPQPVRLTAGAWDDRDPAISPDGRSLAFASHREGSWNLYILDLGTGTTRRLTSGAEFKANPYWSPDGAYLVFEIYRQDNLDIAIISVQGGDMIPLTADPAADYEPAWSPAGQPPGRTIVWVSMRSGNPDLWRMSLDNPDERAYVQLTNTPTIQESNPAFSPNGEIVAYTDAASPYGVTWQHSADDPLAAAEEAGQGFYPAWSPEGSSLVSVALQENGADYVLAAPLGQKGLAQIAFQAEAGRIRGLSWSGAALLVDLPSPLAEINRVSDTPLWSEVLSAPQPAGSDPPYALVPIEGLKANDARLSDRVDEAFKLLRRDTGQAVGWDFLNTLDNALIDVAAPPPPSLEYNSWLKTGRAFDFAQVVEQLGYVKLTREDFGFHTYWRTWLLAAVQDGSQGEPLRRPPWNIGARSSGRPQPYDAGGEYMAVLPPGYFVDFSTLADDYGWTRVPSASNWRQFFPSILYWRYEHRDGLDWLAAMREVYPAAAVATRTPVPSPTDTPTVTNTPTRTATPTRRPTRTPTPTPTRRPTITLTPTPTRRPTSTPSGTWYTATPTFTPDFFNTQLAP